MIRMRTEDDWEVEDSSEVSSNLLSPVTPQQRALPVVQCELSRICRCSFYSIICRCFFHPFIINLLPIDTRRITDSHSVGQCLSSMTNKPQQDPRQMLHSLDAWRKSLAVKMHVDVSIGADVYYLTMQAVSYRFECVLCRLIRRCWQQTQHADWSEWAKQRLRSAILELDTITKRVLASGTLQDFPISLYVLFLSPLPLRHYPSITYSIQARKMES